MSEKQSVGFRLNKTILAIAGLLAVSKEKTVTDIVEDSLQATLRSEYDALPENVRNHFAAQIEAGKEPSAAAMLAIELAKMGIAAPKGTGLFGEEKKDETKPNDKKKNS